MQHAWPMPSRCMLAAVLPQCHQSQQQPRSLPAALCRLLQCLTRCGRGWRQAAPAWWLQAARRQRSRAQLSPCGQVGWPALPSGSGWPLLLQSRALSPLWTQSAADCEQELCRSASQAWLAPPAAGQGLSPLRHGPACCTAHLWISACQNSQTVGQVAERSLETLAQKLCVCRACPPRRPYKRCTSQSDCSTEACCLVLEAEIQGTACSCRNRWAGHSDSRPGTLQSSVAAARTCWASC